MKWSIKYKVHVEINKSIVKKSNLNNIVLLSSFFLNTILNFDILHSLCLFIAIFKLVATYNKNKTEIVVPEANSINSIKIFFSGIIKLTI